MKAWYNCPSTAVIPVGGCGTVLKCAEVFNGQHATKNVLAVGHIDRDDWSDDYLNRRQDVKPLPINEIEGVVCYEPVFKALGAYYGGANVDLRFAAFLTAAQNSVRGFILNKHALNRAKLILELKQQDMRNSVTPNQDAAVMKQSFLDGVTSQAEAETILDEQVALLITALGTDDLMKKFPSKTYQGGFQNQMGVSTGTAFDLVCEVLVMDDEQLQKEASKAALKTAVVTALEAHLFSRKVEAPLEAQTSPAVDENGQTEA